MYSVCLQKCTSQVEQARYRVVVDATRSNRDIASHMRAARSPFPVGGTFAQAHNSIKSPNFSKMEELLRILGDRDIRINKNDVHQAFKSPQAANEVKAWMREYCHPSTLLSKDEAKLFVYY